MTLSARLDGVCWERCPPRAAGTRAAGTVLAGNGGSATAGDADGGVLDVEELAELLARRRGAGPAELGQAALMTSSGSIATATSRNSR